MGRNAPPSGHKPIPKSDFSFIDTSFRMRIKGLILYICKNMMITYYDIKQL